MFLIVRKSRKKLLKLILISEEKEQYPKDTVVKEHLESECVIPDIDTLDSLHGKSPYLVTNPNSGYDQDPFSTVYTTKTNFPVSSDKGKNFPCSICNKRYGSRYTLKRHLKEHTGIKPYVCPVCDKAYTRKDAFDTHVITNHGKYNAM